ncbi:MAG: DUF2141 domain-containing protein [Leptospiraceae bacterium]|nr:DUF2141 domain-containing protein [Leptospiraceae bacterium]MCP5501732.1 DUF2141 domain-containing protein [Leptospiraceae bacterium]
MKNLIFLSILLLGSILNCASVEPLFTPLEKSAEIRISIKGVRSEGGYLNVVAFDKEERFMKFDKAIIMAYRKAYKPEMNFIFKGKFFEGEYAFLCYHDENGNGSLDTFKSGIPREGFGISNNTKSMPNWEQAKFKVTNEMESVSIQITYTDN